MFDIRFCCILLLQVVSDFLESSILFLSSLNLHRFRDCLDCFFHALIARVALLTIIRLFLILHLVFGKLGSFILVGYANMPLANVFAVLWPSLLIGFIRSFRRFRRRGLGTYALFRLLDEWLDFSRFFGNHTSSQVFMLLYRGRIISFLILAQYAVRALSLLRRHYLIIGRFFKLIT